MPTMVAGAMGRVQARRDISHLFQGKAVIDCRFSAVRRLMPYTPIVATLGYVLSPDRRRVLMIHRNARQDDLHLGKYNGLGGKMEPGEDIAACMQREIH